ncbi:hypothetical protein OXX59_010486, partial [Metschnikowia pulcherrima]
HPDQDVNPFVLPSASTSHQNSRAPSRKNTVSNFHKEDPDNSPQTPVRSMLDLAGVPEKEQESLDHDAESIHSSASLSGTPLNVTHDDKPPRTNSELSMYSTSSNGSLPKPKSMLDFGTGDKSPSVRHKDLETKNLLSLEPVKEVITQCETSGEPRSIEPNSEEVKTVNISGKHAENEHPDVRIECDNGQANGQTGNDKLAEFLHEEP